MTFSPENLPTDIIAPILEFLTDRRALSQCALVNWAFNRAATPILYRTLDPLVRVAANGVDRRTIHPSRTLLQKPWLTTYVRHVRESASVGSYDDTLLPDCQRALRSCVNIQSFTWIDDGAGQESDDTSDIALLAYLDILQELHVQELTIRTSSGISDMLWDRLIQISGLTKVAIWCLDKNSKPRVMQGWSEKLGKSLIDLELGRCTGVPASILVSVLSELPLLESLRLRGASSNSIPEILTVLPNLKTLDTEYVGSGYNRYQETPVASLRELTVRTSSMDLLGPQHLWSWIQKLVPRPSLESLSLNAFSALGEMAIPRRFLLDLGYVHKRTLKHLSADSAQLTIEDLEYLCSTFVSLETLSCSIAWCSGPEHIGDAIQNARNLHQLKLEVDWVRGPLTKRVVFDENIVKEWMLREGSKLRVISVERAAYTGQWVRKPRENGQYELKFEVTRNRWNDG